MEGAALTRIRRRLGRALAATLVASLALTWAPASAFAHVPVLEPYARSDAQPKGEEPFPSAAAIDGPDESRAIYGYLAAGEAFDAYRFEVRQAVTTTLSVLVPVRSGTADLRPAVSVVIDGRVLADVLPVAGTRRTTYEPFSFMTLYQAGEQRLTFEPGHRYTLLVSKGRGTDTVGPYVSPSPEPRPSGPATSCTPLWRSRASGWACTASRP
jgi:hypothetical protein